MLSEIFVNSYGHKDVFLYKDKIQKSDKSLKKYFSFSGW